MAAGLCEVCGKETAFGRNIRHRHSGKWERKAHKTNRTFKPNVHKQRVWLGSQFIKLNICTRCLRSVGKILTPA